MIYDRQILKILADVGDRGISVQLLSKHVYNLNATLFFTPDRDDIRTYVQQYLLRNSKDPQSLIESTGQRGYYRLNTRNNTDARQLMIEFRQPVETEPKDSAPAVDLSLDLFA